MSSFVVNDKTLNRIVSFLGEDDLLFRYFSANKKDVSNQDIVNGLRKLNVKAVNLRYADGHGVKYIVPTFTYEHCSLPQAIMHLKCLIYQCCEGDIPETEDLFKVLLEQEEQWLDRYFYEKENVDSLEWEAR